MTNRSSQKIFVLFHQLLSLHQLAKVDPGNLTAQNKTKKPLPTLGV